MRIERRDKIEDNGFKNLMYWLGGILAVAIIAFIITYVAYSNKVKQETRVSQLNSQKIGELVPSIQTDDESLTSASSDIGKTVNEVQNITTNETINTSIENEIENQIEEENEAKEVETNNEPETKKDSIENKEEIIKTEEVKKELSFTMPVEGEISKIFAKDNLIYSETLEEWITHMGIDIKADKTTVVKASEEGTVKSIKNDPRYGLTVVVEHTDGFKTVYSNLLTAEFVSEGEKIVQGQTVGTVGTTAIFEISDEPHLHFEILKDNVQVDPTLYLK